MCNIFQLSNCILVVVVIFTDESSRRQDPPFWRSDKWYFRTSQRRELLYQTFSGPPDLDDGRLRVQTNIEPDRRGIF